MQKMTNFLLRFFLPQYQYYLGREEEEDHRTRPGAAMKPLSQLLLWLLTLLYLKLLENEGEEVVVVPSKTL